MASSTNILWSEKDQFYCDYDGATGALSPVLSSAGFLPLICGAATAERAAALARHLRDPAMFGTAFPVPSIAACDTEHYAKDMWRGPTWVNVNWLIARGLERYDLVDLAKAIDTATVKEIERTCGRYGTFFEYFDDRQQVDPPQLLRKGQLQSGQSLSAGNSRLWLDYDALCGSCEPLRLDTAAVAIALPVADVMRRAGMNPRRLFGRHLTDDLAGNALY